MKHIQLLISSVLILFSQLVQADSAIEQGRQLFIDNCSSCHGSQGGMDMSKRVAPPIIAVRMHYIGTYPDKTSFVAAITDWVEHRDVNKSLMRGAIRKFNLMPPVAVAGSDVQKIAAYIYEGNIDKPSGFDEHFEQMHGRHGMQGGM